MDRRTFLHGTVASAAALALAKSAHADDSDFGAIWAQITKNHDAAVQRLQDWIRQPSIAAENRGVSEGCDLTMRMLRGAGFGEVTKIPTDGQPGIFATLDAGAPRTLGLYFMYDVKQADPAEWSSPPWQAALVDRPEFGKVLVGRGAVNQKGPEATFLAALHAIRGAGRKPPLNFVLVAEGEEEIGSPHFPQIVRRPEGDGHPPVRPLRQGGDRMRARRERGALGSRATQGHSFQQQGAGGQPGVAPRRSARDARLSRRQRAGDRGLRRQGAPAVSE